MALFYPIIIKERNGDKCMENNNRYFEIATTILSIIIAKGLTVREAQEVLKICGNLILDTKVNGVCKDENVTCIYNNNSGADKKQLDNNPEISSDFIDVQLQSYSKLLKSGIIEAAVGE